MAWWEAMVPMGIIAAAFGAMGGVLYGLDIFESGKPKPMRIDIFDHYCIQRDKRIEDIGKAAN